jgi:hypothetical protein
MAFGLAGFWSTGGAPQPASSNAVERIADLIAPVCAPLRIGTIPPCTLSIPQRVEKEAGMEPASMGAAEEWDQCLK